MEEGGNCGKYNYRKRKKIRFSEAPETDVQHKKVLIMVITEITFTLCIVKNVS
jgi:hypothetical protein